MQKKVAEIIEKKTWIFFDDDGSGNVNTSTSTLEDIDQAAAEIVKLFLEVLPEIKTSEEYSADVNIGWNACLAKVWQRIMEE